MKPYKSCDIHSMHVWSTTPSSPCVQLSSDHTDNKGWMACRASDVYNYLIPKYVNISSYTKALSKQSTNSDGALHAQCIQASDCGAVQ